MWYTYVATDHAPHIFYIHHANMHARFRIRLHHAKIWWYVYMMIKSLGFVFHHQVLYFLQVQRSPVKPLPKVQSKPPFFEHHIWEKGLAIMCERLVGDKLKEEFRWLLELAAGCGLWRGTTLVTTARFVVASLNSSPGLWWCSVLLRVLFACVVCVWWCSLRRVIYNCSSP
jgi:hypothetical protein